MDLKVYDNKLVRIIDNEGNTIEGVCSYNDLETNEVLYGIKEESLILSCTHFKKNEIKSIEEITEFSNKYGYLEKSIVEDGIIMIQEVLESEEDTSIYRLLLCIEDKLSTFSKEDQKELKKIIVTLTKYNKNNKVLEVANRIIGRME
jgi:hypothetical protein